MAADESRREIWYAVCDSNCVYIGADAFEFGGAKALALQGQISVSHIVAFLLYLAMFYAPITDVSSEYEKDQHVLRDISFAFEPGQITRAILRKAPIIILDEATASVDSNTEQEIQKAIQALAGSRTIVAIAHRLSTIQNADQILVLEEGRLVQHGTHEELLGQDGLYRWLNLGQNDRNDMPAGRKGGGI